MFPSRNPPRSHEPDRWRNLDRLFDDVAVDLDAMFRNPKHYHFLREKDGKRIFSLDIPGVKPEDVKVTVQNNELDGTVLVVTATRRPQEGERPFRLISERVLLPDGVKESDVSAKIEFGVLTVTVSVPKNGIGSIFKVPVES